MGAFLWLFNDLKHTCLGAFVITYQDILSESVASQIYEDPAESVPAAPKQATVGFEIYCDETENILPEPKFVKPLPVPSFGPRQPLLTDKENQPGNLSP